MLALADTFRPALTDGLAGTADVMSGADQVLEGVFKVAGQVTPVARIQL